MNFNFYNKDNKKFGFLGMRVIKTALAVHICFLIAFFRDISPLYSVFAAIISMKSDTEESINSGVTRIIGTIVGGIFGFIALKLIRYFNIFPHTYIHYLLINIMIIPLIYFNVNLHSLSSTTISCVIFIGIAIADTTNLSIMSFATERVLETSIGVVVSIAINYLL